MKLRLAILATSLSLSACGIGDAGKARRLENDEMNLTSAECRKVVQNGCVQGQVISAPDIYVNGTKFFDANELSQKFKNLIAVESLAKAKIPANDFELTWVTKLDNKSFVQDFQVYLKGSQARQADVYHNGAFALSYLPEGTYDLRVQKTFKFELTHASKTEKVKPAEDVKPETVADAADVKPAPDTAAPDTAAPAAKTYCVTFYAVLPVEIRKDFRTTGVVFDQFEFEVKSCDKAEKDQPIVL